MAEPLIVCLQPGGWEQLVPPLQPLPSSVLTLGVAGPATSLAWGRGCPGTYLLVVPTHHLALTHMYPHPPSQPEVNCVEMKVT